MEQKFSQLEQRRMAKRKPLPYHANQAIDEAIMHNADAVRALLPIVKRQCEDTDEVIGNVGLALHHIHESTSALQNIKREGERKNEK